MEKSVVSFILMPGIEETSSIGQKLKDLGG